MLRSDRKSLTCFFPLFPKIMKYLFLGPLSFPSFSTLNQCSCVSTNYQPVMTSWRGNDYRITVPLWWEFIGGCTSQRNGNTGLQCFLCCHHGKELNKRSVILDAMGLLPDTQNCGCACAGNAGNVFPVTACERSRHASRHVRHARAVMHAGIAN